MFLQILFGPPNDGSEEPQTEESLMAEQLYAAYQQSVLASTVQHLIVNPMFRSELPREMLKSETHFLLQLRLLVLRSARNILRDPLILVVRTVITLALAIFIALVYLNITSTKDQSVFLNISGAIFFVLINQLFTSANGVMHVFITEKPVFLREYVAEYYGLPAYFCSKVVIEFPFQCLFSILTSFTVYYIIGFREGFDHFLVFTLFLVLASLNGSALGFLSSTLVDSPDAAAIIGPLILLPFIIYGGFFVSASNSPAWLAWIQWVSPAQYAFTGLLLNELDNRIINGLSGNAQLDLVGASSRFPIGLNVVFLVVLFFAFLGVAYLGLFRIASKTGLNRSAMRKMKNVLLEK